ncbi:MAG: cell division topological specificity factor MinE [Cyanobacteria bacterium J06560_2]
MAIPLISDLLERFFGPAEDPHSRDDVKRRLKIVLAHDRLALDPQTLEMMRQEIIAVVSRYVEVDFDSLEFSLATDQRVTALTANLPIRRIRPLGRGADQPIASESEAKKIELASQSEILAMDAQEAEAALRRFESESRDEQDPIHAPLDIDRSGLDEDDQDARSEDDALTDDTATMQPNDGETQLEIESLTPEVPDMSVADASADVVDEASQEIA